MNANVAYKELSPSFSQDENAMLRDQLSTLQFENSMTVSCKRLCIGFCVEKSCLQMSWLAE